jgi:hypothetical protein
MNITEILLDKKLSKLGDSYVNFIYSLALSRRLEEPTGKSVKSTILAEALKRAGLRKLLPKRIGKHDQADSAEALIVYAWLNKMLDMDECVEVLEKSIEEPVEAFTNLILDIVEKSSGHFKEKV